MKRTLRTLLMIGVATWAAVPTLAGARAGTASRVDPATHAAHAGLDPAAPPDPMAPPDQGDLAAQVAALRAQVSQLEAILAQRHATGQLAPSGQKSGMASQPATPALAKPSRQGPKGTVAAAPMGPTTGAGGMGSMPAGQPVGGGMGMDSMMKMMGMGSMAAGQPPGGGMGMDSMMKMMGMGNMGTMPMGGAGGTAATMLPSALPGFPGASHVYHVGATGFFLDHSDHVTLDLAQQAGLNRRREQAMLQQADFQRKLGQAEQELWVLTAADRPDATAVERKVQEIARMQGEQRTAFIRAVGEAAKMLTEEQILQLTGMLPPSSAPATDAPTMPTTGGMGDM